MKKLVGTISPQERDVIQYLNAKKVSIMDMLHSTSELEAALYKQLMSDLTETNIAYQKWWDDNYKKHKWENAPNKQWEIDFETCEIFLTNK